MSNLAHFLGELKLLRINYGNVVSTSIATELRVTQLGRCDGMITLTDLSLFYRNPHFILYTNTKLLHYDILGTFSTIFAIMIQSSMTL